MKTHPPCLDWRERLALRHEDLSPADQQALDAHVKTCEACSTALADYHFFEARLDALPPAAIKPLPRLSPHFFERAGRVGTNHQEQEQSNIPAMAPKLNLTERRRNKASTIIWRALSVAVVLCLLLSAGALFRVVYSARLAAHPSGGTLLKHSDIVTDVAWSPNGQYIATASYDQTVKIWSATTGNLVCTYARSDDNVYALAWSPNSQFIASDGGNNTVSIWNAMNCSASSNYATHTESGNIASIAWSPDGQYIASGGWDNIAQIWNVTTGNVIITTPPAPIPDVVSSIAWSPNSQYIAIGSWDKTVQIWDTQTKQRIRMDSDYRDPVNTVAWSPNGRYLAIGTAGGTVEVRDITNWRAICDYTPDTDMINAVAWSPDGKYLAAGSNDKTVRVWNPFSAPASTLKTYNESLEPITSVAWSPDGKEIVSGSFDHTAKVWIVL